MRTWTIQKRIVLTQIQNYGFYIPNFNHENLNNKSLPNSYAFLKSLINSIYQPKIKIEGVVFCMAPSFDRAFKDIDDLRNHFLANPKCLPYFINGGIDLLKGDNLVMELEYPDNFLFLDVDVELFCALDDCLYFDYEAQTWRWRQDEIPFTEELMRKIVKLTNEWRNANSHEFLFSQPANLVQQHVPYIELDNIKNIYPVSELNI